MTTDSAPRIKITYATLRTDNEELHALYEAGPGDHASGARWLPPQLHRRRLARRRRRRSRPARRSIARSCSGPSRAGPPADVDDAIAAARAAQPAWAATPWRERLAILRRAAELISERLMDYSRGHGHRGRQEPASRRSARSRSRRTCCATTRRRWRTTTATTTRWATSATRRSTPARSCGRTASSRSSARSTSRWPSPPGRAARR